MQAAKAFTAEYGAKWPKAAAKITDDVDVLLAFYAFPAEHWLHLRNTNRSNRPSRPCGCGSGSPKVPVPAPPCRDRVQTHRVRPAPLAAGPTHPTWSPSSVPEPNSRTANSSNDPTNQRCGSSRVTRQSAGIGYCSGKCRISANAGRCDFAKVSADFGAPDAGRTSDARPRRSRSEQGGPVLA